MKKSSWHSINHNVHHQRLELKRTSVTLTTRARETVASLSPRTAVDWLTRTLGGSGAEMLSAAFAGSVALRRFDVEQTGTNCPIPATHDKYNEAQYFFEQILKNYHRPWEFQFNLNAFIQALRNITFMLQSEDRKPIGFD